MTEAELTVQIIATAHQLGWKCPGCDSPSRPNSKWCSERCRAVFRRDRARGDKPKRFVATGTPLDRWVAHTQLQPDGCWRWTGAHTSAGYGHFNAGNCTFVVAHKWGYETLIGSVPAGLELDHLCRNRECVNPLHLEPVTHAENVRRGAAPNAVRHVTELCGRGHPLPRERLRYPGTGKLWNCEECRRERRREGAA